MNVDNRIFVIFAMPFLLIAMLRALFWFAGAEWTAPGEAAVFSIFLTYAGATMLFIFEVDLGKTHIGRKGGDA